MSHYEQLWVQLAIQRILEHKSERKEFSFLLTLDGIWPLFDAQKENLLIVISRVVWSKICTKPLWSYLEKAGELLLAGFIGFGCSV